FPQVLGDQALPHSADIWEISRFAAVDLQQQTFTGHSMSSPNAVALLHEVLKVAARHEVRQLITVSPPGIARLLRKAGFDAHCGEKLTVIEGQKIMANW
ncbi:N-acylhomoserine lactone synthase, partial [Acinetobacter baumannii]